MDAVTEVSGLVTTDAGSFALWNVDAFTRIVDYETWERELLEDEDRARHIDSADLVPIDIGSDGAAQILVRVAADVAPMLTPREVRYLVVSSQRYLIASPGQLVLSGIEHVHAPPWTGLVIPLPAGRWQATVHLIDRDAEPGSRLASGIPTVSSLPDFVVLVGPADPKGEPWRLSVRTFAD